MKRLLLLLCCAFALSACLKNDRYVQEQTAMGATIYQTVFYQTGFALDPFKIAFRLNTLIVEGKGDFEAAPAAVRNKLFSTNTKISYEPSTGTYNVTFNGGTLTNDFLRKGSLFIQTNGFDSLGSPNAVWNISLSVPAYSIHVVWSNVNTEIKISAPYYNITNLTTNSWNVNMSNMVAQAPSVNIGGKLVERKSDWSATYIISQYTGNQDFASVSKSIFSVSTSANGMTVYYPDSPLSVTTPVPFKFNPACSQIAPVGAGLMLITHLKDINMENYTEATLLGSDNTLNVCDPLTRIKYNGFQKDYFFH